MVKIRNLFSIRKNYFFRKFCGKTFAVDILWTFCRRNFCGFGQKTPKLQNFLPQTLSSLKVFLNHSTKQTI